MALQGNHASRLELESGVRQMCLALYGRNDAKPLFSATRFDVGIEEVLGFEQAYDASRVRTSARAMARISLPSIRSSSLFIVTTPSHRFSSG